MHQILFINPHDSVVRREALMDFLLINTDELIGQAQIGGALDCNDHVPRKFMILRNMDHVKSKVKTEF